MIKVEFPIRDVDEDVLRAEKGKDTITACAAHDPQTIAGAHSLSPVLIP